MKVLDETNGAIRTITLNRPEKRNALDSEMLNQLATAFSRAPEPLERVAVLRANGPVFCAGLDLRERLGEGARGSASPIEHVLELVENYPLPVVAVVQGDAIAGGNELALHCDFVVAASGASFGMSLAQIGLAPSWFLAKKLLEVAGPVAARRILLLGDPVQATRMAEMGIIDSVVAPERLEDAAQAIIERLAANAPLSLRAMKSLLVREMAFRGGIEHADVDTLIERARTSDDSREGIAARLEKRPAKFRGM
jgi:enoyl-CoA hydratase/carnithine racemase